ncbi:hypothetical protein [Dongia sp.]|uniref:hypothetical protein n=1 Tax=Dongia sp. TaxID=1977262 RepID=UPI0035B191BC
MDTELEIVSAFVAANGGPEEAPSISLTASNYWIVFDDSSRGESQKILRLLSEKFFGGSEPATRRWLATRNGSSCTDYLAINSSSIIKSGVTLIDSSAGIDEQLKCIKVAYLRQIGINADLLLGQSPSSTQLTLEEISRLEGQLVQLLYDPHLSPGQSAVEAYPIIVREALRLIDEQSGRGGL